MTGDETCDRRSHLATDKPSLRGSVANMDAVGDGADGLHVFLPQWLTARPDDPQPPGAAPALLTQVGHLHQLGGHQEGHGTLLTAQHLPLKGDRVVRDTLAHVQQHPVGHSHSVSTLWVTVSTLGSQTAPCGSHSVSTLWVTLSTLWVTLSTLWVTLSRHPVGHTQSAFCGSHSVSTLWVTLSQHPVGHTQSAPCGSHSVSTLGGTVTQSALCGSQCPSQHPVGHTHLLSTLWVTLSQHPVGHTHLVSTLWVTLSQLASALWVTVSQYNVDQPVNAMWVTG